MTEDEIESLCHSLHEMAVRQASSLGRSKEIRPIHKNQLLSWGVLAEKDGKIVPTHAFSLLTGRQGGAVSKVQCGIFRGKTRSLLVNRQEFFGSVQEQAVNVYEYLLAKIDIRTTINGLFRQEDYEFPKTSLREAVVNAIVHRSYLEGRNITVFLFDDRLEITSPGGLLRGVTVDRMREGFSKVRNRALASAFTYMNFIDEYGSGIPRILSECEKEGLPAPQLLDNGDEFRIVFLREQRKNDEIKSEIVTNVTNVTNVTEDPENAIEKAKQVILRLLMDNPKTTQETLAESLGMTKRNIARYMKDMQETGIIRRIGNHRNGSWVVTLPDENESRR